MSKPELSTLVVVAGKESYVRVLTGWEVRNGTMTVNGRSDWPRAVGDGGFMVVPGRVKAIEVVFEPTKVTTKYQLREDLRCSAKPEWVSASEYSDLDQTDRILYAPVHEERAEPSVPVKAIEVDAKAAPRVIPNGITVKAPHHINMWQFLWWTLPCSATREYLFERLKARVAELDPTQFSVTVYTNIKHVRVTTGGLEVGGVLYAPQSPLLSVDGERGGIPSIEGENLDDVLAKAEAWLADRMKPIEAVRNLAICPGCRRKLPTGQKAKVQPSARSGDSRRARHDIS